MNVRTTVATAALALTVAYLNAGAIVAADNVEGSVAAVTLYRGQAQVTRIVPIDGPAGRREIVIENLPEQVVSASLFAEGNNGVEVRAVRYRTRAVGEQPREEVRELDRQLFETQRQLDLANKRQALLSKKTEYLAKLEGFVAPTAQSDLTKGVLDAEALERLTAFSFAQHDAIATEEVELAKQVHDLTEQIELLNRQRAEITAGASQTAREAVLFVQKSADGPAELRLNYLVGDCGWSPAYTMRAAADRKQVRVEYNAIIHQLSGEDWNDVELTLSTASPTLSSAGPGLAPFHVTLTAEATLQAPNAQANLPGIPQQQAGANFYGRGLSKGQVIDQLDILNQQRSDFSRAAANTTNFADVNRLSWSLNDVAFGCQTLEINGDETTLSVLRAQADEAEGPSLSYQLQGPASLASRSDQQMVRIMQTEMASDFYHVAVPVLTSLVYREAKLKNSSDEDMLAGPMTAYLDGRFVGQGELPTVARGETFVVGFGADPQLRARRELADRDDSVQGGNRETRLAYRLVIDNFASEPTPVRVIDRLPHAENGVDIRVTLGESSDPISDEKLYVRDERPMGILRWNVEVPANAAGADAKVIDYKYAVEYDRQYVVSAPTTKQTQQEEFERLQRERQKQQP
jgi:hypothetical protein